EPAGRQMGELVDRGGVPDEAVEAEEGEGGKEEKTEGDGPANHPHSISNSGSPPSTACPGSTRMAFRMPSCSAWISFCIFIASSTTIPCPARTASPTWASTATTRPGM